MEKKFTPIDLTDNGGRRRLQDRRILVSVPFENERRTHWERRNGYDRRLRRILGNVGEQRQTERQPDESI